MKPVRLLDCDSELGLRVPLALIARARAELVVGAVTLEPGVWDVPGELGRPGAIGCLIVEGLLARELVLARTVTAELLGDGDLIHARTTSREESLLHYHTQWHVLSPLTMIVLDEGAARRLGEWPQVMAALLERAVRRTQRMAVHQALLQLSPVETRLLVLFWHLAERWGRVTPQGIAIRLRLSHEMLGQLVGCRRASVTTALARVCESGRLTRRSDATWLLHGSPPGELTQLHWQDRHPVARIVPERAVG